MRTLRFFCNIHVMKRLRNKLIRKLSILNVTVKKDPMLRILGGSIYKKPK